uniref:Uncharacterized protein n=1 Tax=Arundo donax TaxID=35708 RepID=A0A0A8ZRV3_ARUDO
MSGRTAFFFNNENSLIARLVIGYSIISNCSAQSERG